MLNVSIYFINQTKPFHVLYPNISIETSVNLFLSLSVYHMFICISVRIFTIQTQTMLMRIIER